MNELRLIGVHEDGDHLLLSDGGGERYRLALDDSLRAAARRDRPRLGQLQIEIDGGMRPRDVQAMIRSGMSAQEAAERSGWHVDKVRRYEGPILAEREYVAARAREVSLRNRTGNAASTTLASRVSHRLNERGVDPRRARWDSGRNDDGEWLVTLLFAAGGRERTAIWHFDPTARTVLARNDEARWLSEDDTSGSGPIPAPHLVSAPVRATTVYDVEAEGGLKGSARARQQGSADHSDDEPIDLMTAMREHTTVRGRRRGGSGTGGTRKRAGATRTPLDDAPRSDALPLEDMGYDPETMAPPPAAAGAHPQDDAPRGRGRSPVADAKRAGAEARSDRDAAAEQVRGARAREESAEEAIAPDVVTARAAAGGEVVEELHEKKQPRRPGRPSVPAWDDIMFGAPPRD